MHFGAECPFELPECSEASNLCTLSKRVKLVLVFGAAD